MKKKLLSKALVALAFGFSAAGASAALVTVSGVNFDLSYDDAALGGYGTPTLIGNLIAFAPSQYVAKSLNGNPATALDLNNSTVNLRITLRDGLRLQSIGLTEGGDYIKHGALSAVDVSGQTRAWDLAQAPATQVVDALAPDAPLNITNSGLPDIDFTTHEWTASSFSDLSGAGFATTRVLSYTVQNLLFAFTSPADDPGNLRSAFIEKKFVAINVSLIPEPEMWAMMLVGAGLVGFRLRSRSKRWSAARFA